MRPCRPSGNGHDVTANSSPNAIRAVLFDKDGTLLDFNRTFGPATVRVIDALCDEFQARPQRLESALGFDRDTLGFAPDSVLIAGSLANIADVCAPLLGTPSDSALLQRIDLLYRAATAETIAAFDGTRAALKALADRGLPLGIATNDTEETARDHMSRLGLTTMFHTMLGSDSGHGEKPGPGMVQAFAHACDLPTAAIAMVGDSDRDLLAARAAGSVAIAVTSGHTSEEQLAPLADHVLSGIAQLPPLIARLNRT